MSRENLEVVKGFLSRYEAGDRQEWREQFDPDVVWDTSASQMPAAGVYHGHEGVERFFRDWLGTWTDYEVATREYIDAGDAVVVVFRQSGRLRGTVAVAAGRRHRPAGRTVLSGVAAPPRRESQPHPCLPTRVGTGGALGESGETPAPRGLSKSPVHRLAPPRHPNRAPSRSRVT
jgi:ketosteroid isomerase-like protein